MKRNNQAGTTNRHDCRRLVCVLCVAGACFGVGPGLATTVKAGPEAELLEAGKAFQVTARRVGGNSVELRYAIADGYYMYRDRFRFTVDGQRVSLARNAWPAGKLKQDATFGKVITYRSSVRLLLPVKLTGQALKGDKPLVLKASSQGCADAGVCYPPLQQTLALAPGTSAWVSPLQEVTAGFSHDRPPGSGLAERLTNGK